jgi:hypothetical protein
MNAKKPTIGQLIERSERGEDLGFNQVQSEFFVGAQAVLELLPDEAKFRRVVNNRASSAALRSHLIDFMLNSPLPRGLGPWPQSDAERERKANLKAEANALYQQRREDFHEIEDADTSWEVVVNAIKARHPNDPALKVGRRDGRTREEWQVLRDR